MLTWYFPAPLRMFVAEQVRVPGFSFRPRAVTFLALALLATMCPAIQAQSRPAFDGRKVTTSGVSPEPYSVVASHIANVERNSPQSYYAVVLKSIGGSDRAALRFADRLYDEWKTQARRKKLSFDANRSVIFVLAVKDRKLTVHTGTELQNKYGLRNQTIDRKLVKPHFIPHARAGNYPEGLNALVDEIEKWVRGKDQAEEKRRAAIAARSKQIRNDARATLATSRELFTDVENLMRQQADSGLDFSAMATAARQANSRLQEISGRVESDGPQALKDATQAQHILATLRNDIRQMASNQHAAQEQIAQVHSQINTVAELIEKQHRDGLAVTTLSEQLENSRENTRVAESFINSNPKKSLQLTTQQTAELRTLLASVESLPNQLAQLQKETADVQKLGEQTQKQLERAQAIGVDTKGNALQIEKAELAAANAAKLSETDYSAALAELSQSKTIYETQIGQLESSANRRYFITRTVPLWACIGLIAAGLITLIVMRVLHMLERRPTEAKLKKFKTNVVNLSDSLDELKERHRMLPYTDEDFTEPMTGDTLDTYNAVQESLEQFRQRWLTLMDIWEKAQSNLDTQSFFGREKFRAANKLIDAAPVDDVLQSIKEDCIATLNLLEDAHEQHEHTEKELTTALARLQEQLDAVREVDLSTEAYDIELRTALDERDAVSDQRASDPLKTREIYAYVLSEVRRIGRWTEQILHHFEGTGEMADKLSAAIRSADEHRAQGYRFCEDGSDPNALFPKIRHHRSECLTLLNTGEAKTAAEHLSQGFGLIASANERITRQVQAREFSASELKVRPQELDRLRKTLQGARQALAKLEISFTNDSWDDVANNTELAERAIAECDQLLREAAKNGSDDVQFYLTAAEQYERAQNHQNETASLIAAVEQRLSDLEALRDRARNEIQSVTRLGDEIRSLLASSEADRPAANQRLHHAQAALSQSSHRAQATKVDWQDILDEVDFARTEFEMAANMAREDMRLEMQARNEIAEADREIRVASSYYKLGFRADVSSANNAAVQAHASWQSQDYERAIRLANQAVASAREALRHAENQARAKQRRIDRKRRQSSAAFVISTGSGGIGNSSFGSSGFGSSSSSGSFSSGSSSSSWGSGTSVSSW